VRLVGAKIGGTLQCDGGSFKNPAESDVAGSGMALSADDAKIAGFVILGHGFVAEGAVRLYGSQIGGGLECDGGKFQNPGRAGTVGSGRALEAQNAKVAGSVLLREGFAADGGVHLAGAEIGGRLECDGGEFRNPAQAGVRGSGMALSAGGAKVARAVRFRYGFAAEGQVQLDEARIGGNLECHGGRFLNPALANIAGSGMALSAEGAEVIGSILFLAFVAEGAVRLNGAQIRGSLHCDGGQLKNPGQVGLVGTGIALEAGNVKVGGDIFLRDGFAAEGIVQLQGAEIGGDLACNGGKLQNSAGAGNLGSGVALQVASARVASNVLLRSGFAAEGQVGLYGIVIGGTLDCAGGRFQNPQRVGIVESGIALDAMNAKVRGHARLEEGFDAKGEVRLFAAEIGGSLVCCGGRFENPASGSGSDRGAIALQAGNVKVEGDVFLSDGFAAVGDVRLLGAAIRGSLECQRGKFESLHLDSASAGMIVDDEASWPAAGMLFLDGFVYRRIAGGPAGAAERLAWLARQDSFTRQPYRQLAKVLADEGDESGARQVLIRMEYRRREKEDRTIYARSWSWILRRTIAYGYAPGIAFLWLAGLIAVGVVLFGAGYYAGDMIPTEKDAYSQFGKGRQLPPQYERFHASIYSVENSFPLVKLGQVDRWQPDPNPHESARRACNPARCFPYLLGYVLLWFRWIQVLLGWALATMFVAGATGIVRR
jgi:hypothetical protein